VGTANRIQNSLEIILLAMSELQMVHAKVGQALGDG
jgi:hypothetical protein